MKPTVSLLLPLASALLCTATAVAELRLNEIMPINHATIADQAGEFDDWFEIYNFGAEPVELGDYWVTDALADTAGWAFPDTLLGPGDFLLVWADKDPEQGPWHATFKLSGGGETLLLYHDDLLVDSTSFAAATPDTSFARYPDGDGPWAWNPEPTPRAANVPTGIADPSPPAALPSAALQLHPAAPNPFNPRTMVPLTLANDVTDLRITIHDLSGHQVAQLHQGAAPSGQLRIAWNAEGLASGIYLVRAVADGTTQTRRVVLLK
jgi:hypothetical protein